MSQFRQRLSDRNLTVRTVPALAVAALVTGVGLTATTGEAAGIRTVSAKSGAHTSPTVKQLPIAFHAAQPTKKQAKSVRPAKTVRATKSKATKDDRTAKAARADRSVRGPLTLSPLSRYTITATFGQAGGRWARNHTGLDFAAPSGTPVRAVAGGKIIATKWAGPYGNQLRIRHADGTESWYNHLSRYKLTSGTVRAGTVIAYVGTTGNSTGPHLHLEIRKAGSPINPMTWLRAKGVRV